MSRYSGLYLEVGRVHPQFEGVQLAQFQQAFVQVVDLGHGQSNTAHDLLTMVLHGGRAGAQVRPVREVGLSLGVNTQQPVDVEKMININQLLRGKVSRIREVEVEGSIPSGTRGLQPST